MAPTVHAPSAASDPDVFGAERLQRQYTDRQAAFAPSVRWKYSNLAYAVAGLVVEKVSGERWADYVEQNIFKPLEMNGTSVDKDVSGLAVPYGRRMPYGSREVLPFLELKCRSYLTFDVPQLLSNK
jgi:D-alanyl-D-alanine carboxypeptidase